MHTHTHSLCEHSDVDHTRAHTLHKRSEMDHARVCTHTHTHTHTLSVNTQRWISLSWEPRWPPQQGRGGTCLGSTFARTAAPVSCLSQPSKGRRQRVESFPVLGLGGLTAPPPAQPPAHAADPDLCAASQTKTPRPEQPPGLLLPRGLPSLLWEDSGVSVHLAGAAHPRPLRETAMSPTGQARTGCAHQSPFHPGLRAAAGTGLLGCLFLGACWTRGSAYRGLGRGIFLQRHRLSLKLTFSSAGPHLGVSGADPGSEPQPTTPSRAISFPPGGSGPL